MDGICWKEIFHHQFLKPLPHYTSFYRYHLAFPSEPMPSDSRLGPRATCEGANGAIGGKSFPQKSRCEATPPGHGCRVLNRVLESHKHILGSNFLCQKMVRKTAKLLRMVAKCCEQYNGSSSPSFSILWVRNLSWGD